MERIVDRLSSARGDRTQDSNSEVAALCLGRPSLVPEIVAELGGKEARRVGDCAEVLCKIAEEEPELVAPHAAALAGLLRHKNGRVRWESTHALALVADRATHVIEAHFDELAEILATSESVIQRDRCADSFLGHASTSENAYVKVLPILRKAALGGEGKQAARILNGFCALVKAKPARAKDVADLAHALADHERPSVRTASKALLRACR